MNKLMDEMFANVHYDTVAGDWRKMPETEPPDDEGESEDVAVLPRAVLKKSLTTDFNPNHDPKDGEFAESAGGSSSKQTAKQSHSKVILEVAPNPDDEELTSRWKKIDEHTRAIISSDILDDVLPDVLDKLSTNDKPLPVTKHVQLGGYLDESNPSISLIMGKDVSAAQANMLTRVLGSGLSQQSILHISTEPFKGSTEWGSVVVRVPKNISFKECEKLYNKLRLSVVDKDGNTLIYGHTTDAGRMVILTDTGTEESLHNAVLKCLGSEFEVGHGKVQVAMPDKGDDDYGFSREAGHEGRVEGSPLREWVSSIRSRATTQLQKRIEEYEAEHK
jgi:hypothetical protein